MSSKKGIQLFKPYVPVIVGLDVPVDDENRVLEDPDRINLEVTREAVQDVLDRGIDTPVKLRMRGGVPEVVFGRQRIRTARVAWDVEEKQGIPLGERTLVPATFVPEGISDLDLRRMVVGENLARQNEDVVSAARKAQSLLDLGDKKSTVAELCRVSPETLRDWLKLVRLHPEVQELVRAGHVGFVNAVKLMAGVKKDAQPDDMRRLIVAGKAVGLAAEAEIAVRSGRGKPDESDVGGEDDDKPALPGKRALKQFAAYFAENVHPKDVFTRQQVGNLLDHVLYGTPLRGPIREHWQRALPAPRG